MKYAGIGSRETPPDTIQLMHKLASALAGAGYTLRSGAAPGADAAFEFGCDVVGGSKQIFLPWPKFNKHNSTYTRPLPAAAKLVAAIHPAWDFMSPSARLLCARNMHQILGPELNDPVQFVVCWTSDGCENIEQYSRKTGGTGTAIALASSLDVPVYNLFYPGREFDVLEAANIPIKEAQWK